MCVNDRQWCNFGPWERPDPNKPSQHTCLDCGSTHVFNAGGSKNKTKAFENTLVETIKDRIAHNNHITHDDEYYQGVCDGRIEAYEDVLRLLGENDVE